MRNHALFLNLVKMVPFLLSFCLMYMTHAVLNSFALNSSHQVNYQKNIIQPKSISFVFYPPPSLLKSTNEYVIHKYKCGMNSLVWIRIKLEQRERTKTKVSILFFYLHLNTRWVFTLRSLNRLLHNEKCPIEMRLELYLNTENKTNFRKFVN